MNKNCDIDSNYATIIPVNLTGNNLWYREDEYNWNNLFVLYDWGNRSTRSMTTRWLNDHTKVITLEHFAREPNALHSGRIQIQQPIAPANIIEESRRMRIHFQNPKGWMALAEWWSGATWNNDQYAARITMGYSPNGLIFYMDKQRLNEKLWRQDWMSKFPIPVPIGQWFDLYIRIIAGDKQTGRFQVAFKLPEEKWDRKIDIHNYTYNPGSSEIILPHFTNPLMLYTGANTIKSIINSGQKCRVDLRRYQQWTQ